MEDISFLIRSKKLFFKRVYDINSIVGESDEKTFSYIDFIHTYLV